MRKYNKNSYRTKRNCKDRKINVGKLTKEKVMHDKSRFNFYNVCNKYNHFKFPKRMNIIYVLESLIIYSCARSNAQPTIGNTDTGSNNTRMTH